MKNSYKLPALSGTAKLSLAGGTMSGAIALRSNQLRNVSSLMLQGSGANRVSLGALRVLSSYSLTSLRGLPGTSGQMLISETSGKLSWSMPQNCLTVLSRFKTRR
jgi:hypothetical protein